MPSSRRYFLIQSTAAVGALGAAGAAVPFVQAMLPSARARAQGAPVKVDVSRLRVDEHLVVEWRRQPLYIVRRSQATLAALNSETEGLVDPDSDRSEQPQYAANAYRSRTPEYLVLQGICTHLGCAPKAVQAARDEHLPAGGFLCPCHDSRFDYAGRVLRGYPAGRNLSVPPYYFETPEILVVGLDAPPEERA